MESDLLPSSGTMSPQLLHKAAVLDILEHRLPCYWRAAIHTQNSNEGMGLRLERAPGYFYKYFNGCRGFYVYRIHDRSEKPLFPICPCQPCDAKIDSQYGCTVHSRTYRAPDENSVRPLEKSPTENGGIFQNRIFVKHEYHQLLNAMELERGTNDREVLLDSIGHFSFYSPELNVVVHRASFHSRSFHICNLACVVGHYTCAAPGCFSRGERKIWNDYYCTFKCAEAHTEDEKITMNEATRRDLKIELKQICHNMMRETNLTDENAALKEVWMNLYKLGIQGIMFKLGSTQKRKFQLMCTSEGKFRVKYYSKNPQCVQVCSNFKCFNVIPHGANASQDLFCQTCQHQRFQLPFPIEEKYFMRNAQRFVLTLQRHKN